MQAGHGPSEGPEPEGDGGTSPGASWVPWEREAPAGPPAAEGPPTSEGPPTTELGTWTVSAGGQGTWEPPPGGGHGGWGPPPAGGYGQPSGGYGQPGGGYGQPGGGYGPPGGGYGRHSGRPPERRRNHPLLYVLVAVVAAALGAGAVFALQARSSPSGSSSFSPQDVPSPASSPGSGNTNTSGIDEQAVATKVEPGLVDITATLRYTGQVFEGTGMVLSSTGLVLTNNHVVDGSTGLTATVVTTGRRYRAQIVGTDNQDDIALLKLVGVSGLRTVQVGDSSKVTLGSQVVAMGNAGGQGGPPSITSGSITALNRTITASDAGSGASETLHNMLQTNARIAEGDSGGPLANAAGQVIGMNTAANTQSFGPQGSSEGFAIPINRALAIAHQMAAGRGSAKITIGQPPFLGIQIASTAANGPSPATDPQQQLQQIEQAAQQHGGGVNSSQRCLPSRAQSPVPAAAAPVGSGALIAGAFCNSPAHSAGMLGGDVITAVNGRAVSSAAGLTRLMLARYHPGDIVSVSWVDANGQHHTSSLTLAAGPAR